MLTQRRAWLATVAGWFGLGRVLRAAAPWAISGERNTEPMAAGARYHELTVAGGGDVSFQLVEFRSDACTLKIVDQPDAGNAKSLAYAMREAGALAGVNGGFFTPEFQPLGLVITDGKRVGSWMKSSLLGGVVLVKRGRLMLLWREEMGNSDGVTQLVQAGPRLVNHGSAITGLDASKSRARTFIATDNAGRWMLGLCEYTSLAGLAEILSSVELIPGFQINRALNFDGGKSSALWLKTAAGREVSESEFTSVRNFVALFPK
jgi:hypothetical protein